MATLATMMAVGGTTMKLVGGIQQANAARQAAKVQSQQLREKAAEEKAVSQRKSEDIRRKGKLVESRQRAIAAKSGGGVGETANVANMIGGAEAQSFYNAAVTDYSGDETARRYRNKATMTDWKSKRDYTGTLIATGADALGDLAKMTYG